MILKHVISKADLKEYYQFPKKIYAGNKNYRSTEDSITKLLIEGPTHFHSHAVVKPYLIKVVNETIGRFALIQDALLPDYVQLSFFEIEPDHEEIIPQILHEAKVHFPQSSKIVAGLNGHLNYGAGYLLNHFDEPPVFGLPYTPEYYPDFFRKFIKRPMVSYRFSMDPFFEYLKINGLKTRDNSITVRKMNKKNLQSETKLYTWLNNACFTNHPYWAGRHVQEDFELFHPFRFLIQEENLLFAEKDGKPIGFFLWYPDFNQLVKGQEPINLFHLLKHKLASPINTFRFTEIAVLPKYQRSHAVQAMILQATHYIQKQGIQTCEGGFIFQENKASITMTLRLLERASGKKIEPYRRYAVYEKEL